MLLSEPFQLSRAVVFAVVVLRPYTLQYHNLPAPVVFCQSYMLLGVSIQVRLECNFSSWCFIFKGSIDCNQNLFLSISIHIIHS